MEQEEYKLFLNQVNKLTDRRQNVTTVYLTVNSAIVGALAFLFKDVQMPSWAYPASAAILLVSGVAACSLWRRLISQYSVLLGWWYEQLRDIETAMPNSRALLTEEYEALYGGGQSQPRVGLTRYEIRLTWLFTVLYASFGLALLVTVILKTV